MNAIQENAGKATVAATAAGEAVKNTVTNAVAGIQENIAAVPAASTEFVNSNSIVAKIAFVFLVLILFIILFKIGVVILVWLLGPQKNPMIVDGLLDGSTEVNIEQDSAATDAIPLPRSKDGKTGAEFTWSLWLKINAPPAAGEAKHVFNKGNKNGKLTNANLSDTTIQTDSPGLYITRPSGGDSVNLVVTQNYIYPTDTKKAPQTVTIDNIPLKKWIHVAIRLQNTVMDVYVNGALAKRTVFDYIPKQSYGNLHICNNGGFSGALSNLRYYSSALSIFSIQNIIWWGPNTKPATIDKNTNNTSGNYMFFSNSWYSARY